jgi:hypothetical protein
MTPISKDKPYPKYVCSGSKNKGICSACYIKRDEIEQFVLKCIKETLRDPQMFQLSRLANTADRFNSKASIENYELHRRTNAKALCQTPWSKVPTAFRHPA